MDFYGEGIPAFGVAGNFTGHLEQAGEAESFRHISTDSSAPKAIFPTYIPRGNDSAAPEHIIPPFLHTFPFSFDELFLPKEEARLQIEPECAILCELVWSPDGFAKNIVPRAFCASNDCSIRREGGAKISIKKNWGAKSKGLSRTFLPAADFSPNGILNQYRIASFLLRDGQCIPYGEDSAVCSYSYMYDKLLAWLLETLNGQKDEGPCEDIRSYLCAAGKPSACLVSIGATRYTDFGKTTFLRAGDDAVVMLYPQGKYSARVIEELAQTGGITQAVPHDISFLRQRVVQ